MGGRFEKNYPQAFWLWPGLNLEYLCGNLYRACPTSNQNPPWRDNLPSLIVALLRLSKLNCWCFVCKVFMKKSSCIIQVKLISRLRHLTSYPTLISDLKFIIIKWYAFTLVTFLTSEIKK